MTKSKDEIQVIIFNDLLSIHNRRVELTNRLKQNLEDNLTYLREIAVQLSQPSSGPFVTKTPKILRTRVIPRIETIPENEVLEGESSRSTVSLQSVEEHESILGTGRSKRLASKKAADNIKKQSFSISEKPKRQLEYQDESTSAKRARRQNSVKRKKSRESSSDEDYTRSSSKYSKDEDLRKPKRLKRITRKKSEQVAQAATRLKKIQETEDNNGDNTVVVELSKSQCSDRSRSKSSQDGKVNKVDDMIIASNMDNIEEPSMYEDAIEKPTPIMNSTMKHSSEKKLNVTVVLERLPLQAKLNETMVIKKAENHSESKNRIKKTSQDSSMQSNKEIMEFNNYNGLITEDESSPEIKKPKYTNKKKEMRNSPSSNDEIPNTPIKTRLRCASTIAQEKINKATYKSSALFSPYAKESVKKRVEAFEHAVMHSPKSVDMDAASRVTRSKTRAMNTPNTAAENAEKNIKQILARKSIAKAKKISLAKEAKDTEEFKEVNASVNKDTIIMPERVAKLLDKPSVKQVQQKSTPLGKLRMVQPPASMNRLQTPTNTQNYPKVLSAQRSNILINMDTLLPKSVSKTNSEKMEDKKRNEEDARKKREDTLRLMTEEKRRKRQEKELKNKLAREAKEKLELEKRQRIEREREEKAKLALLMQEKQREEMEKKRLAQVQRAQEKEERRKLEEQQRLQKLQEQEEMEHLLAEQRRREQEADKRREAEVRAQQQAASEALRQRQLMLAAQAKNKPQGPTNYKLESEPDDDSDDESRPKHEIPYWAQSHNRKAQLAMQRHIPQELIYKFFDTRKCTPDLTEMFQGIDRSRLKRTSSAIWKTPPRTDMMEVESGWNRN